MQQEWRGSSVVCLFIGMACMCLFSHHEHNRELPFPLLHARLGMAPDFERRKPGT